MAISTLEQRRSLVSWARPWMPQLPKPDGAVTQGDRYQLAWLYRSPADSVTGVVCLPYLSISDLSPALMSMDMIGGVELVDLMPSFYSRDALPSLRADDLAPDIFSQDC